ncbi:hypothetical protein [Sedimentibacter sp.]|uniref:hypothetical protein n=1 Tax=Sedimentibacter sp. TaxID=1960295 RepID=UPI0028B11CA3|nr:hypothetical protein [Sedimentibacter sp.]
MRFISILVFLVSIVMLIISLRAIFFTFAKKKDERSKWIVKKSMADSFIAITILQTLSLIIKWLFYDSYQVWWNNFKEGIYIEPVLLSYIILGIILIINTRKYGGSL